MYITCKLKKTIPKTKLSIYCAFSRTTWNSHYHKRFSYLTENKKWWRLLWLSAVQTMASEQ